MSFENDDNFPYGTLGLSDADEISRKAIKRAYARKLKEIDAGEDPQAFQNLRSAYECALEFLEFADQQAENEPVQARSDTPFSLSEDKDAGDAFPDPQDRDNEQRPANGVETPDELAASDTVSAEFEDETGEHEGERLTEFDRKLAALRKKDLGYATISELMALLDDPDYLAFEKNWQLGLVAVEILERSFEWSNADAPQFLPHITKSFLVKLDQRFHFSSDFRALEQYSYNAENLQMAILMTLDGRTLEQMPSYDSGEDLSRLNKVFGHLVLIYFGLWVLNRFVPDNSVVATITAPLSAILLGGIGLILFVKIVNWAWQKLVSLRR